MEDGSPQDKLLTKTSDTLIKMTLMTDFHTPEVAAHFAAYPPVHRARLLTLRALIFRVAAETPGVGDLTEALRWGEPAYLTLATGSGSLIRMDWKARAPDQIAIYFHCKTGLIDAFRCLFNEMRFEGNRAILFDATETLPETALRHCFRAALTYHLSRKT